MYIISRLTAAGSFVVKTAATTQHRCLYHCVTFSAVRDVIDTWLRSAVARQPVVGKAALGAASKGLSVAMSTDGETGLKFCDTSEKGRGLSAVCGVI